MAWTLSIHGREGKCMQGFGMKENNHLGDLRTWQNIVKIDLKQERWVWNEFIWKRTRTQSSFL
jgi:hypothetical protein